VLNSGVFWSRDAARKHGAVREAQESKEVTGAEARNIRATRALAALVLASVLYMGAYYATVTYNNGGIELHDPAYRVGSYRLPVWANDFFFFAKWADWKIRAR